jgi:hypothetical protein
MEQYLDKKVMSASDVKTVLHPYVKEGSHLIKKSHSGLKFPPFVNELEGWRRQPSKSALPTGTLTQGVNVDFEINSTGGHISTMYVELTLKENNTAAATISPYQTFERIEYYVNNGQDLFRIVYPDENYFVRMIAGQGRDFVGFRTKRLAEYLNADYTPQTNNLAQNGTTTYLLEFNLFEGSQPDIRNLKNGILCRFYFNQSAYFCNPAGSTNVSLSNMNILIRQLNIPQVHYSLPLRHNYINYTRNLQSINPMAASTQYDIKLNSLRGCCAFLIIFLRANPVYTNYTNENTFLGNVANIEFHDRNNQLIAFQFYQNLNNYIMAQHFDTDFINSFPTGPNVWILPFSTSPSQAEQGVQHGFYNLSSDEIVRITTNSSFSSANVEVAIWGAMYEHFDIHNGMMHFTK